MKSLVTFFINRHLLSNVIFVGILILGLFTWRNIGKEEMPEFASNWIRVTTIYPGAPAEDVELFVTKPLEEELKGVIGIEELVTTSSLGVSSLRITLDDDYPDKDEVVQDIKDAVLRANLPSEVRDLPKFRQFKSSEKAILDIGLYHKNHAFLDQKSREELQKFVLSFENQLLALKEVSSIDRSHYRKPELQILVDPEKNQNMDISLSQIKDEIQKNNIRVPVGSLEDKGESKVTALNELESVDALSELILQGNYEGYGVKLQDIATIRKGFDKTNSIFKINGKEGIFLNVKKSISTDILSAQKRILQFIENFKKDNVDAPIGIVLMDDESFDVRNRLNIISWNGLVGFILIVLILFTFLDAKMGFWVAMGIPFCMGFTLIIANIAGYTVNNMTLAGIIIVLGIVVDDAIIIAENISRHREEGENFPDAAIKGTLEVFRPILASIITTCVAFIPLLFFEGFFGKLVTYIPLIVILMLIGSLFESLFILPAHLAGKTFFLERFSKRDSDSWFHKYEKMYEKLLLKIFEFRYPIMVIFIIFFSVSAWLFQSKMKFVMFPREESKEVFIKVKAKKDFTRLETATAIAPLEEMLASDTKNVVGVRSSVGLSRRGGEVKENEASILVELYPADERKVSLDSLLKKWKVKSDSMKDLKDVKYRRGRWGHGSGNALEIQIQENDDLLRQKISLDIESALNNEKDVIDVEVDKPLKKKEYLFHLKQDQMVRRSVSASSITTVLRAYVEGSILYSINKGIEEVDVRLSVPEDSKNQIDKLLQLKVENKEGQLIFLKDVVEIKEIERPINITRNNFQRSTMVYANIKKGSERTPLEVAEKFEQEIFPKIINQYPTSLMSFKGEVENSRESTGEFVNSVYIVILLIYFILVVMFNSLFKPFVVLSVVPFGLAGVVCILMIHGMSIFGFFAAIGALGMVGVVINDAIVMIDKIEKRSEIEGALTRESIAYIASTRLRPVLVTTITTVAGILPTAYGIAGYDSMLAEMMLTMGWGLAFGTFITLALIPTIYTFLSRK